MDDLRRPQPSSAQGVTLVELLIVTLITAILGAGVVAAVTSTLRAQLQVRDMSENLEASRRATHRIRDTVRASYGICSDSRPDLLVLWQLDANRNRVVEEAEVTAFRVEEDRLQRADGAAVGADNFSTLMTGVSGTEFTYFDASGNELTASDVLDLGLTCDPSETATRGGVVTVAVATRGEAGDSARAQAVVLENAITLRNAVSIDGTFQSNRPPDALFDWSCDLLTCTFSAEPSQDTDGEVVSYSWQFGDSVLPFPQASGQNVTYTYGSPGSYIVLLTVEDDRGLTATGDQVITVSSTDTEPVARITGDCAGLTCTFDATESRPSTGGSIDRYLWSAQGGVEGESDLTVFETSTTEPTLTHSFSSGGNYFIELTVVAGALESRDSILVHPSADPTDLAVILTDQSVLDPGNSNRWFARVQIEVRTSDGAAVVGAQTRVSFGSETFSPPRTNSIGQTIIQSNDRMTREQSVVFRLDGIDGYNDVPTPTLTLTRPVQVTE